MTVNLPPLASRALALAVLVGLAFVVYAALVEPVLEDFAATRQRLAQDTALAERYRRLAEALSGRRAALAKIQQKPQAQTGFLASANDTVASAELQSRIKGIVEAAQGELKSTQILPVQQEGDFRRIGVRGEMSLALPAAQRVLYEMETSSPWLVLDNVDINTHEAERRQERNPGIAVLDLSFDAYGYLWGKK